MYDCCCDELELLLCLKLNNKYEIRYVLLFLLLFIIADIKSNTNNLGLCLMKLSSEIYFKICHYFEIIKKQTNRYFLSFFISSHIEFVTVDDALVYVDKEQGIHYNKFKFPPNERYDKKKLLVFWVSYSKNRANLE